jgi:hypothetical protein
VPEVLRAPEAVQELEAGAVLTRLAAAPDMSQRDGSGPERKPREGGPRVAKGAAPRAPRPPREDRAPRSAPASAAPRDAAPDAEPRKPRSKAPKAKTPYDPDRARPQDPGDSAEAHAPAPERGKDAFKGGKPYRTKEGGKPSFGKSEGYKGKRDKPGYDKSDGYKGKPPRAREDCAPRPERDADTPARSFKAASDPSQRLGPDGKPVRDKGRPGGKFSGKPGGKFAGKPGGKPGPKPGGRSNASPDGKPARKTFAAKGANAVPKRRGPKV